MSDKDKGEMSKLACVTFTRRLPGPIDKVWAHLTEPHLLPAWFGDNSRIEPRQGGAVHLMGGHVRGVVTQWQPPHKLIYTWNVFSPGDGPDAVSTYPESYPTFELQAEGSKVLLTFRHFPILDRFIPQNANGLAHHARHPGDGPGGPACRGTYGLHEEERRTLRRRSRQSSPLKRDGFRSSVVSTRAG